MKTKILFFGIAFCLTFSVFGQEKKARRIVEVLCSDSLYGRGYVDNGVNKAAYFLRDEFKKAGLQTFLDDDSYLQPFTHPVNTFPGIMSMSVDGEQLIPGEDFLVDPVAGSFDGKLEMIEIDTTVLSDLDKLNPTVAEVRSGEKNTFYINLVGMSGHDTYVATQKLQGLAMVGTVVFVTNQKLTWSVSDRQLEFPLMHVKPNKIDPSAAIEIHIDAKRISDFESNNVIGYLPSEKKRAKTIVFSAHYDHLGGMGTTPKTYFPGGNDNASGTAMLISMADYFRTHPSDYNIVFIAFAGEEAGLLCSKYFVEQKTMKLKEIEFLLNLDIMGSGEEGITVVNGRQLTEEFKTLTDINDKNEYLSKVKPRGETANSDHYFFYKNGVPCFFIYTMGPNKHYHDVYDTYEELSFAAYDDIVMLLIDFVGEF